jgi:hypothetical protein
MATMLDHQVGLVAETTFATIVTPTRFFEWLAGNGLDWDPEPKVGAGLRVGSQIPRSARRFGLVGKGSGKIMAELASKGFGTVLKGAWGTATHTLVSGTTYQQLYTAAVTGTFLDSFTIQEGIVRPGGTVDAYTFGGCSVSSFEIEMPDTGIATTSFDLDARSLTTSTALASATYPTSPTLYRSSLPLAGNMTIGGTLTPATTTALASTTSATPVTGIKSWTFTCDNALDLKRDVLGGRNQPVVGLRELKLKTTVEYDAVTGQTFRDALIGQSSTPIVLTATTDEALSAGTATMQLVFPAAFVTSGAIPQPGEGEVVTTDIEWDILDNLTALNQMVLRTADTAL